MRVSGTRRDFNYYLKILTEDRGTLFFYKYIRAPLYRFFGYPTVSPYHVLWYMIPLSSMELDFNEILKALNTSDFNIVIDHACGDFSHYTPMLKRHSKRVFGVDIINKDKIKDPTDYIQVPMELKKSYFPDMASESVDCVVMFNGAGMHPHSNWIHYVTDTSGRMGRYLTPENYPRLLKKGGYIIAIECETYPEKRFKRASREYINEHIKEYYPYLDLPGFDVVLQGFLKINTGPYIVFRKK
jgi:hypothetical protein